MAKKQLPDGETPKRFESKYNPTVLKQLISEKWMLPRSWNAWASSTSRCSSSTS